MAQAIKLDGGNYIDDRAATHALAESRAQEALDGNLALLQELAAGSLSADDLDVSEFFEWDETLFDEDDEEEGAPVQVCLHASTYTAGNELCVASQLTVSYPDPARCAGVVVAEVRATRHLEADEATAGRELSAYA